MTDAVERLTTALADRYRIEREVGQGGMATVYLAEDLRHRRKVAVKVLRPQIAATLGAERFSHEIEVAARLQHPHILPLLDSGEADGFFYYVMPFVEGESLRERLARQGELPVHEAVRILGEIVDALAYAHAHGVVHRDIKPDNIMLSGRHALITDFGVAKAVSEATGRQQLTTAGVALGTPAYMAPEQAAADPHLDHRVDIYAVGALAYELLTGRPPFTGRTPQEILAAHVTTAPDPVDRHRPGLSPGLTQVIMRCLAKRPADRWQTAEELLTQLGPLVTPSGGMTPTQTVPVVVGAGRRFPRWAAWAGAGTVVMLGALALTLVQRPPAPIAIGRRLAVSVAPALEQMPNLSPDGRMIAWVSWTDAVVEIVLQQVDGGAPVRLTDAMPGFQAGGAFSPDGTRLLFLSSRGLEVMPSLGGQSRIVVGGGEGDLLDVLWGTWSPDGREIAYTTFDSLFVAGLDGSGRRALAAGTELHSPAWSPDGEWIAYVEGNPMFYFNGNIASSAIRIVRATGGDPVAVTAQDGMNLRPVWLPGRRSLLFISDRDGGRDIYEIALKGSGTPAGPHLRVTTGLNPEWISLSADGSRLAWSVYTETANVWSLRIPSRDSVPLSRAQQVTSGAQKVESWDVSPDGAWLYYDSDRSGNMDIWRQPLAGGAPEQVTTDPAPEFLPRVSPDGKEVAFHAIRNGQRDVFIIPAAGGSAVQVSTAPSDDRFPVWSPDGKQLMWEDRFTTSDSTLLIARRKPDGSWEPPRRLEAGHSFANNEHWWVQGGAAIAYDDSVGRMHFLDPETGVDRQGDLTVDKDAFTVWSQDGRLVYAAQADSLGGLRIIAYPAAGGPPRVLAYADNPRTQAYLFGLVVHDDRLYFNFGERRSDVWVGEVTAP